jgi:hypothetical protein
MPIASPARLFLVGLACALALSGTVVLGEKARPDDKPHNPVARPLQVETLLRESMNETPSWFVQLSVPRTDRTYQVGDTININVTSEKDGYLYLFNIDAGGEVSCLFPNQKQKDNKVQGGKQVTVPDPNDTTFKIKVTAENLGKEYVKAIVTKDPVPELDLQQLIKARGPTTIPLAQFSQMLLRLQTGKHYSAGDARLAIRHLGAEKAKMSSKSLEVVPQGYAEANLEITTVGMRTPAGGGPRRVGLFVGVSKYKDQGIRELSCSHQDAMKMENAMKGVGKLNQTTLLTNEKATLSNIRSAIENMIATTRPGDTIVIYWSGHGGQCANVDGTEPDGLDAYLVPYDGSLASNDETRRSMLLDKTFARWVQEMDGRKVVVIIDTCHSGGNIAGMKSPQKFPQNKDGSPRYSRGINPKKLPAGVERWSKPHFLATQGLKFKSIGRHDAAVLAACRFKQYAFERREGDLGVMTYYILEKMNNGSGHLVLKDLYEYVSTKVPAYVEKEFPGSPQNPVFSDETQQPALLRP